MRLFKSKKRIVAVAAAGALVLGAAGGAFAYFTSNGSGTGTGSVGSAASVTVDHIAISGLTPGGPALPVSYKFTNPTGNGNQTFGIASVSVDSITGGNPTCSSTTTGDFTVADSSQSVGQVDDGATYSSNADTEPTIAMQDTGTNQDDCQGAVLHLTVSVAQGA